MGRWCMADEVAERAAVGSANAWRALVDDEADGDSWETAAVYFQKVLTKEQWEA